MNLIDILRVWLVVQLFSLAALPLAWRWLGALPSRGYALAKPLGLLLVSYLLWLGASLGLLRNSAGGILLAWLLVLGASLWLGRAGWQRDDTGRRPMLRWLRERWALVALSEGLFLAVLVTWSVVRSYSPEITTAGGEKFMELAFLNGILRSQQFPPQDPWLSGFAISYYYFGYVMLAAVTRLSGLAASVAFNIGLAAWFALTLTAAFGIGYDLAALLGRKLTGAQPLAGGSGARGAAVGGLLTALFLAVMGNLAGLLESLFSAGVGPLAFWRWLDVKDLNCLGGPGFAEPIANCPQPGSFVPDRFFWWWRASRVITDRDLLGNAVEVIDEFPFFSFLLGDMHPHVLALPFVLLAVGAALALLLGEDSGGEVRGQKSEGRGQRAEDRGQRAEDGGQRAEDGGQRAEDRGQRAEDGGQRAEEGGQKSKGARGAVDGLVGLFPLGWVGFVLAALVLGGLGFLNTWDFPIYLFLTAAALTARMAWQRGGLTWGVAGRALLVGGVLAALGVLLYLPFYAGFQSQAGGILPNFLFPTHLSQLLVMFGPLLAALVFFLTALSTSAGRGAGFWRRFGGYWLAAILLPLLFLTLLIAVGVGTGAGQEFMRRLLEIPLVQQQVGELSVFDLAAAVGQRRAAAPWAYLALATLLAWTGALLVGRAEDGGQRAEGRGQKAEVRGQKAEVRGQRAEDGGQRAEGRGQRAEDGGQRAEDGGQRAEGRGQRAEDGGQRAEGSRLEAVDGGAAAVVFALVLALTALLLIFSVEFVYLRDTFGTRMNTVFKFYFQAWVLLALAAGFGVVYIARCAGRVLRWIALPVVAVLVVAGLFYPVFATYTRAEKFQTDPTLDGTAYLDRQQAGDAAAIAWLRANVPGNATVLEAPGGSYSYAGRISAQTGLPTLLGWDGHELQWRGDTVEQDKRRPDIERIYRGAPLAELQTLLDKWQIDYVVVGQQERSAYGVTPQSEARLAQAMDLVYDAADVRIYRRRN